MKHRVYECGCQMPIIRDMRVDYCPVHDKPVEKISLICQTCLRPHIVDPVQHMRTRCDSCQKVVRRQQLRRARRRRTEREQTGEVVRGIKRLEPQTVKQILKNALKGVGVI